MVALCFMQSGTLGWRVGAGVNCRLIKMHDLTFRTVSEVEGSLLSISLRIQKLIRGAMLKTFPTCKTLRNAKPHVNTKIENYATCLNLL